MSTRSVARILLALLLVPAAAADPASATEGATPVAEMPLPEGARNPATLAFANDGYLWATLEGSWAVARVNPSSLNRAHEPRVDVIPLAAPRVDENDALSALTFGPDGDAWTASRTHAHRVSADTQNATAYPMPQETLLSGDVHVQEDGTVWVALVTADTFARLDPETGDVTLHEVPVPESRQAAGPLVIAPAENGLFFTATYGNTYGHLNTATGHATVGPANLLDAPTGIVRDGDTLWIGEHGGSTIGRVDAATDAVVRYPSTPSPYYPASGPTGLIRARDGSLWAAQHFAARVARLDPAAGTLHEFTVPSAPNANMQSVAEGPDGRVWFASWTEHRIGFVTFDGGKPPVKVPDAVTVKRGETTDFPVDVSEGASVVVGSDVKRLPARYEDGRVTVDATYAPVGRHHVLVSVEDGSVRAGRYVSVDVVEPSRTPAAGGVAGILTLLAVAGGLAWRRVRS